MSGSNPDELEVTLNGQHYRLASPLQFTSLKTFPGKVVTGDYSLDSNPLLSAWIISDLTGGHGVIDINEATDTNRYRDGDINTRYPKQFTLPFQYNYGQFGAATDVYVPLGNMLIGGANKYLSTLNKDLRVDEVSLGLTALTASPLKHGGVAFAGTAANEFFYMPMANSGYATYDPTGAAVANFATPTMHDFIEWDNKLVGIDANGQLWYITAAAGVWTKFDTTGSGRDKMTFQSGSYALESYVNQNGDPTIHILSSRGVWAFDASAPRLYQLKIRLPPHPHIWSDFCVWDGNLWIGVGMDIIQWNGSVSRNLGLSRDDGIPYALQGRVIALIPELNSLYALVQGYDSTGVTTGYLSVHEWSGYGWRRLPMPLNGNHMAASRIAVMNSDALGYKLVMGTQGYLATGNNSPNRVRWYLPLTFTAPRAALEAGVIPFGASPTGPFIATDNGSASFETGRFDGNMQGYTKIASSLQMTFSANSSSNQPAVIYYRTEANSSYTLAGTVPNSIPGRYEFQLGAQLADGSYPGLPFQFIELKVTLYGGASAFTTPVLQNIILSYEKVVAASYSWVANIQIQGPYKGRKPQQILDDLKALAAQAGWFGMVHRGTTYRVQISAIDGQENLSHDERSIVKLSIIEIPASISAPST